MTSLQHAYQTFAATYTTRNPTSQALYNRATRTLPGGNTRTVLFYPPFPLSIARAHGSTLYDADGHAYTDLLGEYTAGLYGHTDPIIIAAITEAAQRGLSFGSQHEDETTLANLVRDRFPSMQLLRFTNSGTEATLMALAVAKVFTGRKKILCFAGAYHGSAFAFAGGKPGAVNAPHEYLIARYNDLDSVHQLLREPANWGDVAAIIVEAGLMGSIGAIPSDRRFLEGLRRAADEVGAVLIFDEVMTSRFYSGGGMQSRLPEEMWPDLTTLGKYIGGGMSFGAFGGKSAIMQLFDPRSSDAIAHAGTFNNNVLTMAAGIAGLTRVFTPERAERLHETGDKLRARLNALAQGTLMKITGCGSIMCFHFTATPLEAIKSPADFADSDPILHGLLHLNLLEKGYYIARRGFIALSLALSDAELDGFSRAVSDFVRDFQPLLAAASETAKL